MIYDESTGEMVEVEEDVKPALWKAGKHNPVSIAGKHTGQAGKHSNASTWSASEARAYGRSGGLARRKNTTPERRQEIARKAAQAMWAKKRAEQC